MNSSVIGHSKLGQPIWSFSSKPTKGPQALIIGGVHGDEVEGVIASWELLKLLQEKPILGLNWTLIPQLNTDGVYLKQRQNSAGVDLNRNLPTKDWSPVAAKPKYNPGPEPLSEPENKALIEVLNNTSFDFVLSIHSWKPMINVNADCTPEATAIHKITGLDIKEDIGYPTPGSLGTYLGHERNIPTITMEIEKGIDFDKVIQFYTPSFYKALEATQEARS